MDAKVNEFFEKEGPWIKELRYLRVILQQTKLVESLKWGQPCYSYKNNNLVILGAFKDHCVLSFFKGVLLKDEKGILEFAGPNTQSAKVFRIRSIEEIKTQEAVLIEYINQSIQNEKLGRKVTFNKTTPSDYPLELIHVFAEDAAYQKAFELLSPGRQKGYILHFSSAKQIQTRINRIIKAKAKIMAGKGMQDR